ncbi:hypothetical protein GJU39_22350 [Pedobacter petrophilus]|uniref:Uncharacterized protein n=1 Tax=Pedobacter petrophilus TaxID=1908241 RepID=A0A7K0G5B3_9SPHI|nr:hypothetical protein [Pedobacter petrophilus]MRX78821.1 hypothetical protein [Pedobacter petrophilus]
MQDNNRHLEILQALAAGTDPVTGEVFPEDSPYNQPEIIRALFFAINLLEALAEKGNQGLAWGEEEDELFAERFSNGSKVIELVRLHSRITMNKSQTNQTWISTEITKPSKLLNCRTLLCKLHFVLSKILRTVRRQCVLHIF